MVEGSPTKIDYREKVGTLILTSLLEDLRKDPLLGDPDLISGFGHIVQIADLWTCLAGHLVGDRGFAFLGANFDLAKSGNLTWV